MSDNQQDLQTVEVTLGNGSTVVFTYFDYYGLPYFRASDIFSFVGNLSYSPRVKSTLRAGIDYFKMQMKCCAPYFVTPEGIVHIVEGMTHKNIEHVIVLYTFFKEKYHTECIIPDQNSRRCIICGEKIPVTAPKHQVYCSKKCKDEAYLRRMRERFGASQNKQNAFKKCPQCGKEFKTDNPRKVFCCRNCQVRYNLAIHLKLTVEEKTCPVCGTKFLPTTPAQVTCSLPCRKELREMRKQGKMFCKQCNTPFVASKRGQEFCCRDCEVAYYSKRNFFHPEEVYPEEYRYFVKKVLPKMPDYFAEEPSKEELLKPDYQRRNSILVSFEPYPV